MSCALDTPRTLTNKNTLDELSVLKTTAGKHKPATPVSLVHAPLTSGEVRDDPRSHKLEQTIPEMRKCGHGNCECDMLHVRRATMSRGSQLNRE